MATSRTWKNRYRKGGKLFLGKTFGVGVMYVIMPLIKLK